MCKIQLNLNIVNPMNSNDLLIEGEYRLNGSNDNWTRWTITADAFGRYYTPDILTTGVYDLQVRVTDNTNNTDSGWYPFPQDFIISVDGGCGLPGNCYTVRIDTNLLTDISNRDLRLVIFLADPNGGDISISETVPIANFVGTEFPALGYNQYTMCSTGYPMYTYEPNGSAAKDFIDGMTILNTTVYNVCTALNLQSVSACVTL